MRIFKKIGGFTFLLLFQPLPVAAQTNLVTYFENLWHHNLTCESLALRSSPYFVLNQTIQSSQSTFPAGTIIDYSRKKVLHDSKTSTQYEFSTPLPVNYLDTAEKWNFKIEDLDPTKRDTPQILHKTLEIYKRTDGSYWAQRCCSHLRCKILPIFKIKNSTTDPLISFDFQNSQFMTKVKMQKVPIPNPSGSPALPAPAAPVIVNVDKSPAPAPVKPERPRSSPWLQHVVCTRSDPLRIYDDSLENVIYRIQRFQEIKVYQGWNGGREERRNGDDLLIRVLAHNGQGVPIHGWAAAAFIKRPEDCPEMGLIGSPNGETLIEGSTIVVDPQPQSSARFPTEQRPLYPYTHGSGRRYFGAPRDGRLHAASDLFRHPNEKVYAVSGGEIINRYHFYAGSDAIEVKHDNGTVIRYGEVSNHVPGLSRVGDRVVKGQHIGNISHLEMLHFELYQGTAIGPLTQNSGRYSRRSDLIDPTSHLQRWEEETF